MELTLGNLISFLEKKVTYDDSFTIHTVLREYEDGIAAVYLFEDLSREFNVNFENFNFHKYFLDEAELNTMTWKSLFQLEKQREIQEELTIQMLFDYMISNAKSPK